MARTKEGTTPPKKQGHHFIITAPNVFFQPDTVHNNCPGCMEREAAGEERRIFFSVLTMFVDEQDQVFPVERVNVEQQSRTLTGPEAQGDVFSSQRHIGVDGGRQGTTVPAHFIGLLEDVGDGRGRLKAG